MNTRRPAGRRAAPTAAAAPAGAAIELLAQAGREQWTLAIEASAALRRGFEAMREVQQHAVSQAAARQQQAAQALRQATDAVDLMLIPWGLWRDEMESATHYWQELAAAALEAQTELVGCTGSHLVDSESALHAVAAMEALQELPARSAATGTAAPRLGRGSH